MYIYITYSQLKMGKEFAYFSQHDSFLIDLGIPQIFL